MQLIPISSLPPYAIPRVIHIVISFFICFSGNNSHDVIVWVREYKKPEMARTCFSQNHIELSHIEGGIPLGMCVYIFIFIFFYFFVTVHWSLPDMLCILIDKPLHHPTKSGLKRGRQLGRFACLKMAFFQCSINIRLSINWTQSGREGLLVILMLQKVPERWAPSPAICAIMG